MNITPHVESSIVRRGQRPPERTQAASLGMEAASSGGPPLPTLSSLFHVKLNSLVAVTILTLHLYLVSFLDLASIGDIGCLF